jgi:ABC-type transporter Mla subunit MlaD
MISAIVDGVLLLALVATTVRMLTMHRELRRLGSYHEDYQRIFDQTALALDGIEVSIQEINVKGAQILNALGNRMDDARELIAEIDGLTREAKRQQSVLRAELKELSKATAVLHDPKRFAPIRDDIDIFAEETAGDQAVAGAASTVGRKETTIHRGQAVQPAPARVHRIDNSLQSPFRTVSLNQKDKM